MLVNSPPLPPELGRCESPSGAGLSNGFRKKLVKSPGTSVCFENLAAVRSGELDSKGFGTHSSSFGEKAGLSLLAPNFSIDDVGSETGLGKEW